MNRVELSDGPIEYDDTGGDGPVIVFTHGFPMNGRQWGRVLPYLDGYRCVLPTFPLGAHRLPMHEYADLSQQGLALLVGEFLEALDLDDVTLVVNDWGGPQFLLGTPGVRRVGRLVLVACEAFDNFPPPPARPLSLLCRAPGGTWLLTRLLGLRLVRHGRRTFGALSRAGLPDNLLDEWFAPARTDRLIRRDLRKFATGTPSRATLLEWSGRLRTFERPALVVWADEDVMMPALHGPRLVAALPNARLVTIEGSATLVPWDR
ncbi:MAG: alpha/beta hydrolase, partial [Actinomycetota bacterium]|nr:alpha/beta hydrolase [Actinomycetota bacterium]